MATSSVVQYLDDDGEPVGKDSSIKPPAGYSLLSSKKSDAPKKIVKPLKEVKEAASKLKPVAIAPIDYTANPKNEGLYEMYGQTGSGNSVGDIKVPFSKVQSYLDAGGTFAGDTGALDRYTKDKDAVGSKPSLLSRIDDKITAALQPVKEDPKKPQLITNLDRSAGRTVYGAGKYLVDLAKQIKEDHDTGSMKAMTMLDPAQIPVGLWQQWQADVKTGDHKLAMDNLLGSLIGLGVVGAVTHGAEKTAGKGVTALREKFTPVTEAPVRERTNIIHDSPSGQVRQKPGEAPSVWLENPAWQAYVEAMHPGEDHAEVNGVVLAQRDDLPQILSDPNASKSPHWPEVQKIIAAAHEASGDEGIAVGAKRGRGVKHAVNIMREELNHTAQRKVAGSLRGLVSEETYDALHKAIPKGMQSYLKGQGYDLSEPVTTVSEAAAKLMGGNAETFGVTPAEKKAFLKSYFTEIASHHGPEALNAFTHLVDNSKSIKEQVHAEQSGAKVPTGANEGLANNGIDDSTLQSLSGGGRGGPEQIYRRAGSPQQGTTSGEVNDNQLGVAQGRGIPGVEGGGQGNVVTPAEAVEDRGQATVNPPATGELATNSVLPGSTVSPTISRTASGNFLEQIDGGWHEHKPDNGGIVFHRTNPNAPTAEQVSPAADTLFNRDRDKPIWYLKSERLIGDKMKGPQSAEDVHKMLLSGGVKPEEMHWTGLEDFLKSKGKDKVTPEEIREHLANNNIQIKEVTKGKPMKVQPSEENPDEFDVVDETGRVRFTGTNRKEAEDYVRYDANLGTKYGSYVLPGGESYREMLLTMQPKVSPAKAALDNFREQLQKKYGFPIITDAARTRLTPEERAQEETLFNAVGDKDLSPTGNDFKSSHWDEPNILAHVRFNDRTNLTYTPEDIKRIEGKIQEAMPNYGPASWGSGATDLAVRKGLITPEEAAQYSHAKGWQNDTTGATRKLLHIEEAQSDWHQLGRDKGYALSDKETREAVRSANEKRKDAKSILQKVDFFGFDNALEALNAVERHPDWAERWDTVPVDETDKRPGLLTPEDVKTVNDWRERQVKARIAYDGVPDAPFKKTWHEMALRRLLKHAVDNNYSGLSWTGGADQAERYSLSKQVKKIAVPMVNENGTRSVRIEPIDGSHSFNMMVAPDGTVNGTMYASQFSGKKLDEVIGKEMAERVMAAKEPTDFAGEGLNVGGAGMRGFYDKIVPDYLNKFGKKFGAKVSPVDLPMRDEFHGNKKSLTASIQDDPRFGKMDLWATVDAAGNWTGLSGDPEAMTMPGEKLVHVADRTGKFTEAVEKIDKSEKKAKTVQHLPITPEMRKSVAEEGVPLFNRERENPNFPDKDNWIKIGAQDFAKQHGRDINLPRYITPDFRAKDIADAYDDMKHNPADPKVKASYDALKKEIRAQWDYATQKMGMKFEPWKSEGQPYKNSAEMTKDVRDNHHLYFFQGGDMPADHPLADADPKTGLSPNDELRAVHDLFGHAMDGYEFGKRGEENAWNAHSQMFSPEAIPALTTETKGQNSWVNFGKQMRDAKGNVIEPGQPGFVHPKDRPYADQKAGLLPDRFHYRIDTPISFISPNVRDLDLKGAASRINDAPQKLLKTLSDSLAESLNLKPKTNSVIGRWDGGAENSLINHFPMNADPDAIRYHDANLAMLGNQNAWAAFFPKEGGADDLFVFDAPKGATPEQISEAMSKHGIEQHTMEQHPDGVYTVYIGGSGHEKAESAILAANELGVKDVESIGGDFETRGNNEDREKAVEEHLRTIEELERVHPAWRESRKAFESRPDYNTLHRLTRGDLSEEGLNGGLFNREKDQSDIEHWTNYSKNMSFDSEQEARDWTFKRKQQSDEQYGDMFGRKGEVANRAFADSIPIRKEGKKFKIGAKIKTPVSKERFGQEEPDDNTPAVDWHDQDLQDSRRHVDEASILKDYGGGKPAIVYRAYIDPSTLEPKLAEEDDEDGGSYPWEDLEATRGRTPVPPAKILVRQNGKVEILDGNHRVKYWQDHDFDSIPAWVIDRRKGVQISPKDDASFNREKSESDVEPWVLAPKMANEIDPDTRAGKIEAWVEQQGPKIVSDYLKKFSPNGVPYISSDAAKELIPEYAADPTGLSNDVRVAARTIANTAWDSVLSQKPEPGKERVIVSTGSPASGKTTGILSKDQQASVGITRENIPPSLEDLSRTLDSAIASGRKPILMLTYTDDPKINMERAIKRAVKDGRPVPMDHMANAWLNLPKIIDAAMKKYGDQIDVYTIDNSGKPGEQKVYANDVSLPVDAVSAYSHKKVMEAHNEVLEQYKPDIPRDIYEGFRKSTIQKADSSGGVESDSGSVSSEPDRGVEEGGGIDAAGQPSLDANTNERGAAENTPEPVETGGTGTARTTEVPVQGGTKLVSAPKQETVVPVAKKVLSRTEIMAMAAAMNPSHHQVRSVRELMEMARQRMVP